MEKIEKKRKETMKMKFKHNKEIIYITKIAQRQM